MKRCQNLENIPMDLEEAAKLIDEGAISFNEAYPFPPYTCVLWGSECVGSTSYVARDKSNHPVLYHGKGMMSRDAEINLPTYDDERAQCLCGCYKGLTN